MSKLNFSTDAKFLNQNSRDLENINNQVFFSTFYEPSSRKISSTLATLHRKNYPQNIQKGSRVYRIKKQNKACENLPEFVEEFLKEKTPKIYKVHSRIKSYYQSKQSPVLRKNIIKGVPKPVITMKSYENFKSNLSKSNRIATSQTRYRKILKASTDTEENKTINLGELIEKTKSLRIRKKETKIPQYELRINEKISRLREIIKDPLVYGLD